MLAGCTLFRTYRRALRGAFCLCELRQMTFAQRDRRRHYPRHAATPFSATVLTPIGGGDIHQAFASATVRAAISSK